MIVCELLTLATPFVERESHDNNHQKTYSNIVQGKFARHWKEKEYRKLHSRSASLIDSLLQAPSPPNSSAKLPITV